MLSTRRDLFPPHVADQLVLSQDKVAPSDDKLTEQQIEVAMSGLPVEAWLGDFEIKPLASASIAQVHVVRLKSNGKEVMIRVVRPNILPVTKVDLELIYRLARWVSRLLSDGHRLRPTEVVREYEKTLIGELNSLRESVNATQLRRNSKGNPMLYISKVCPDYCSEGVMMTEHIYGIPVPDVAVPEKSGTSTKLLAERGVQIFFTQVSRNGLSHAGTHPSNIFISYEHPENPKYIGIDCGIAGLLDKEDKRHLTESFIASFNRDYREMAELHVDSGWVPSDTNVEKFEFAVRTACEPIFGKPLAEISFGHVLLNLLNTVRCFNMEVQP